MTASALSVEVLPAPGLVHLGMPCNLRLIEPKYPRHFRLSWDAQLFLVRTPLHSGFKAHIVVSCTPDPLHIDKHVDLLSEVEGHSTLKIDHLSKTNLTAPNLPPRRKPPHPTPHIIVPFRQAAMNMLYAIVGSPHGRGGWLARRLSPHFSLSGVGHSFHSGVQYWISV